MTGLPGDQVTALRGYAAGRRADLPAMKLRMARHALAEAGLVRYCTHKENPMMVTPTDLGARVLADALRPVQLELFAVGAS